MGTAKYRHFLVQQQGETTSRLLYRLQEQHGQCRIPKQGLAALGHPPDGH